MTLPRDDGYLDQLGKLVDRVDKVTTPTAVKWPFKRVLNNHVIVQINDYAYTGRIAIPDSAKRKPTTGVIVALADDITDLEVGERVLFSQYAGYLLKFKDLPLCRVLSYNEVICPLHSDTPDLESESA
jgi:co-chaperonin GroES (HSP10)